MFEGKYNTYMYIYIYIKRERDYRDIKGGKAHHEWTRNAIESQPIIVCIETAEQWPSLFH